MSKTDLIFDTIDSFLKVAVDYINERYQITKKVEDFRKDVIGLLYTLKRHLIRSIVEVVLIASGVLALILGIILFANRFLPLDIILMAYGVLMLIIVLGQIKLRP
ncbi:MAG: hypothetical protein KJ574_05220 [Nanoarchaeota archaeon]|nr:hypothetical protein [Nanoarchaeota archaeon]